MPAPLRDGLLIAAALLLLIRPVSGQSLPPAEHRQLARDLLQELVEINTVHDSGATRAATALAKRLTAAGFGPEDVQLVGPKPHKQNLVVRLRGRGNAAPILFLAHLDVVEARKEDWSLDPFTLTERDGYLYGRGTMDIKDEAADLVANLLRLKAEGYVPGRDIVVALTDDEEGGDDNGVSWLLQHRPELIKAAYVINTDAGGGQMKQGRRLRNPVQTSEKTYATYLLEVTGPGGHSSLPPRDNTIYTLAKGLQRLSRFDFPVRLNPATRAFFRRLAEQESGQVARDLRAVSGDYPDPKAAARLGAVPLYNSSMRTTCVATMLQAGHAENALPQRARATIQCRLLPGESPEDTKATLTRVLSDTLIRVTLPDRPEISPASPLLPEVMSAVERVTAAMWPGVVVLPVMDPWSSDGARLRQAGVPVYGVSGIFIDIDDIRSHGKDERIGVQAFYEGVEFMYRLMKDLAGPAQPAHPTPARTGITAAESLYAHLRAIRDRIDVNLEAGRTRDADARPLTTLVHEHNALREELAKGLAAVDSTSLRDDDARALGLMRLALRRDLGVVAAVTGSTSAAELQPACDYDAGAVAAAPNGLDSLRKRLYACYGWAQSHLTLNGETLDRLSILGALGRTDSAEVRRKLFLSLEPVWRSLNRTNRPESPYRQLIAWEVRNRGNPGPSAAAQQAQASGVPPDSLERWLVRVLETWRDVNLDSLIEPWDWYYQNGLASRKLSPLIPLDRLASLNRQVYGSLGADVGALGVQYDLAPRAGKTPVAYSTFGSRPRLTHGRWSGAEPWVFATYRTGGLDNLNELLHETGHAVHIAAIRARPAFSDWPDSDPFTEAVADFVALDVYEPVWQQHWLGDSVPLADGLRSRYAGIVLDVAWALFELRMQQDPAADPNQVWTTLTRNYLRIRPHPELSWWAMRGQLVDAPGYMMNYAAGAIVIAAIRARTRAVHGPFVTGDSTWYSWVAPRLYRFGLERSTRDVVEQFLGGPVSPEPLLADMRRMSDRARQPSLPRRSANTDKRQIAYSVAGGSPGQCVGRLLLV